MLTLHSQIACCLYRLKYLLGLIIADHLCGILPDPTARPNGSASTTYTDLPLALTHMALTHMALTHRPRMPLREVRV